MDDAVEEAGRKATRIFFSCTVDFSALSTCCHYREVSSIRVFMLRFTYNGGDIREFLIGSYSDRLNEELVSALGVHRWFLLHCL